MRDIRLVYLLFFGTVGTSLSFQTLFLQQRGLSDVDIGLSQTAQGLAVFLAPLVSAHFADKQASSRTALVICLIALTLAHVLMLFSFGVSTLLLSAFLMSLSYAPIFSLLDSSALELVANKGSSSFTQLRVWGSIGFLLPALVLFPLLRGPDAPMAITVSYGGVTSIIAAIAAWYTIPKSVKAASIATMVPSLGALKALLKPSLRGFTASRFLTQVSIWIWYPFFPIYLKQHGYDSSWIGPIVNIGVVAEIIWALGITRYDTNAGGRLISMVASGSVLLRMLLLTALPNIWIIVIAQLLHAPYIWAMFFRGTVYISSHVEDRYRTSFLALNGILFHGITRAIGGPLGGTISEVAGSRGLDGISSAIFCGALISGLGMLVAFLFIAEEPAVDAATPQ